MHLKRSKLHYATIEVPTFPQVVYKLLLKRVHGGEYVSE